MEASDAADGASERVWDILVVGGGPVGLHAAHKAAVLEHSALVIDKGRRFSRAAQAEAIGNIPLRPGVSGDALLDQLRASVAAFEDLAGERYVSVLDDHAAVEARRDGDGFRVRARPTGDGDAAGRWVRGRTVVLATGAVDRKPGVDAYRWRGHETQAPYVHEGEVGYCVLCEGWEVDGERVAVVGSRRSSARIAVDLAKHFHGDVTLLTDSAPLADDAPREELAGAGVAVDDRAIASFRDADGALEVDFGDGARARFHKAFMALGGWYKANSELAAMLGARLDGDGFVMTDENSEARAAEGDGLVEGLFAVGDVRAGRWKQIPVGWGDAETAVITAYAKRLPQ